MSWRELQLRLRAAPKPAKQLCLDASPFLGTRDTGGFTARNTLSIQSLLLPVGVTQNQKHFPRVCLRSGLEGGTFWCWGTRKGTEQVWVATAESGSAHGVWLRQRPQISWNHGICQVGKTL